MKRNNTPYLIITAVALILIALVASGVLMPALRARRQRTWEQTCINNQKLLATVSLMYAQDNDGALPPPSSWHGALSRNGEETCCPAQPKRRFCYGYNANLADPHSAYGGIALSKVHAPATVVLIADCRPKQHCTFVSTLGIVYRHNGSAIVSYVDGHVDSITAGQPVNLDPKK
jgi:prepilin-type processing-associated H-X9-DG protein